MKNNQELLLDIIKSLASIHKKQEQILKRLDICDENIVIIKKQVLDLNYRMPERKDGWFRSYWEIKKH